MAGKPQWIISCEHASAEIPQAYQTLFDAEPAILSTHRGFDIGALAIAKALAQHFGVSLWAGKVSRLLVDLNRSVNHPQLWSEWSQSLSLSDKTAILEQYYWPYRQGIEAKVRQALNDGYPVYHLSIHSFTPILNGVRRKGTIGLLYDSSWEVDRAFVCGWQSRLKKHFPSWQIRRNYPYLGKGDGLATYLRKIFRGRAYTGIEIEINQNRVEEKEIITKGLIETLSNGLRWLPEQDSNL